MFHGLGDHAFINGNLIVDHLDMLLIPDVGFMGGLHNVLKQCLWHFCALTLEDLIPGCLDRDTVADLLSRGGFVDNALRTLAASLRRSLFRRRLLRRLFLGGRHYRKCSRYSQRHIYFTRGEARLYPGSGVFYRGYAARKLLLEAFEMAMAFFHGFGKACRALDTT